MSAPEKEFTLTITRKSKIIGCCVKGCIKLNGTKVGNLPNGGSLTVQGQTGDVVGVHTPSGKYEFKIREPGDLVLRLKMVGDMSFAILFLPNMIYKLCRDGGQGFAPCKTGNPDLDRGAIEDMHPHSNFLACGF